MIDSNTEYHLRIWDDGELLHARSESPFMVPRVAEFVHVHSKKFVVVSVIYSLLDSSGNLIHDCLLRVEPRDFRLPDEP
jgi:hypothetical protein